MTLRSRSLFLALGVSLVSAVAPGAGAQSPGRPGVETAASDPSAGSLRATIDRLLTAERLDFGSADQLYAGAVLAEDLNGVYGRLDELVLNPDPVRSCRAAVLKAVLQWRDGDLDAATDTVAPAIERCPSTDAMLLRARLLDIQNQAGAASVWYEKARAQSQDPSERALLDRRLAVIGVTGRKPDALARLAAAGDGPLSNRAATVLGLLGRPGDASALYRPGRETGARYRDGLRLADWAIGDGDPEAAAASAWSAVEAAATTEDRLYALALLVEAFRAAGDLPAAEVFLAGKASVREATQVRLDVLLELERYDDAVALVRQSKDEALSERALGVLRAAGRTPELEAEYQRLIQAQPADPRWSDGLAALYLGQGRVAPATAVYRGLLAANRSRPDVQIETARKMIAMGMGEEASRSLGDAASSPDLAVALRRFEVETAIDQGREPEAEAGLRALAAAAPRDTAVLVGVAEDYERLGRQDLALETLLGVEARGGVLDDDQQAHIADLAFAAGRPAEALTRWRALWAQTRLPARKAFLQRQIIRAAQQTQQLEPIAAELESRISSGAADQGEVSLLVEIRIAQQDGAGAERAVQRYAERAGTGEVRTLEQLAAVQARLRNYAGLNASLARLAEVDPANADAYLRRLIINVLRFPDPAQTDEDRNRRVDALMTQMRAAGKLDDGEAARFAASIYTAGYRSAEALVQHQRALALAPDDIDALLEYTAARRAKGEVAEAASLLQFKAETAPGPAAFVGALNGLLDVLAAGDANSPAAPADLSHARLGWARRAALERLLQDGEDVRLSSLIGDIGQDRGDAELQLRALQASLAVAGDQKPAVLRQLISLTSPSEAGPGDPVRKAVYGRRLVAMRKPYPPEVYADLAKTFLQQGDGAAAERAFALMGDIGGLVNVDALRGEAYAEAGKGAEALASYRRALLQDQDNLDLVAHTAVLLEQAGDPAEAAPLYWKGLMSLVQRQPVQRANDAAKALDAAQFAPTLIEGTVLTWAPGESASRLGQWRQTLAAAARQTQSAAAVGTRRTLADYPRLALAVAINGRLAASLNDPGLAALQLEVLEPFAQDAETRQARGEAMAVAGTLPGIEGAAHSADRTLAELRRQADADDNVELSLVLAFEAQDRSRIRTLVEAAIARDAPWRRARETGVTENQPATLLTLLLMAADLTSPEVLRDDILAPLSQSGFNDLALYDVYRVDPARFARLEAAAGRRLLADEVLIPLLATRGNDPLPVAGSAGRRRGGPTPLELMTQRFGPDALLQLYDTLVQRLEQTGSASALQDAIVGHLLDSPLNAGQRARLASILVRDIGAERPDLPNSGAGFLPLLLRLDAPAENRPVLMTAAQALAARHADSTALPGMLQAWFAGDRAGAFESLTALGEAVDPASPVVATLLAERFERERDAAFERFLATPNPSRQETAQFQRRYLRDGLAETPVAPRVADAYARLAAVEPANGGYVAARLFLQANAGDFPGFVATATPFAATRSDDPLLATLLGLSYRLAGDDVAADRTAQAASVDLDDPEWIGQLSTRAAAGRSSEVDLLQVFPVVWAAYQARFPSAATVAAFAVPAPRLTSLATARPLDPLASATGQGSTANALRGLWRATVPRGRENGDTVDRQALIDALADPASGDYGPEIITALTRDPAVLEERERELAALSPGMQGRQMRLYRRVAEGSWALGLGQARLDRLTEALAGPPAGVHRLALFLAFETFAPVPLEPRVLEDLGRQLSQIASPPVGIRLEAARAYGRAGASAVATALLRAAVLQSLYPAPGDSADFGDPRLDGAAVLKVLAAYQDQTAATQARDDLARLLQRQSSSPLAAGLGALLAKP